MKYRYKILIVDNEENEEMVNLLKKGLEQEGYDVDMSLSATEALEKVKSDKYHIVLTAIAMPQMDGLELLREIKKYDPLAQVIMMTEFSTMSRILSALEYGASDYIIKPFKSTEYVLDIIQYAVKKLERWRDAFIDIVQ
ncbi:response regulator [Acetobacterium tundrae]|uniref:Stage 0 sporulation protein A homolog n=1 Tax=Acetobacterium tundrae TaxID=132932 RepID=A0ABR6WN05_9FIRM|nr:response regulator [Acetobacterium tundrae]MBC3797898.1 response regulator [Acetobacterium tundrae]